MNRDCDDIRRLLDAWIDGELSSSAQRRVARHVDGCPACQREAEARGDVDAALRADADAGDPGDAYFAMLGERIKSRFDFEEAARHWARQAKPAPKPRLVIPRAWVPRFAFGIAGAAVVVIAGFLVHDLSRRPLLAPRTPAYDGPIAQAPRSPGRPQAPPATSSFDETTAPREAKTGESPTAAEPAIGMRVEVHPAEPAGLPGPVPSLPAPQLQAPASGGLSASSRDRLAQQQPAAGYLEARGREKDAAMEALTPAAPLQRHQGAPGRPPSPDVAAQDRQTEPLAGTAEVASESDWTPPSRAELLAFFATAEPKEGGDPARGQAAALQANESSALRAETQRADSAWIESRRAEARVAADSALAAPAPAVCEAALRAYWRMLHRDGRALIPDATASARALEPDRARIDELLRCLSR